MNRNCMKYVAGCRARRTAFARQSLQPLPAVNIDRHLRLTESKLAGISIDSMLFEPCIKVRSLVEDSTTDSIEGRAWSPVAGNALTAVSLKVGGCHFDVRSGFLLAEFLIFDRH